MRSQIRAQIRRAQTFRAAALLLLCGAVLLLTACGSLKVLPVRAALYDFGPGLELSSSAWPASAEPQVSLALPLLALAPVESGAAVDSLAVLYRLAYDNPQQLRPYAAARWSMPAGQLFEQRLRQRLEQQRRVVRAGEGPALSRIVGGPGGRLPWVLRLELEEFSQVFSSPSQSQGVLRLRASVLDPSPGNVRLVAQRMWVQQVPAATADAAGGVQALGQASDAAAQALADWLMALEKQE